MYKCNRKLSLVSHENHVNEDTHTSSESMLVFTDKKHG